MKPQLILHKEFNIESNLLFLVNNEISLPNNVLNHQEREYVLAQKSLNDTTFFEFNRLKNRIFIQIIEEDTNPSKMLEGIRKAGDNFQSALEVCKINEIALVSELASELILAFAEGMILGNYSFVMHKVKSKEKAVHTLQIINLVSKQVSETEIQELNAICEQVYFCRDLINQPVNHLNAVQFSEIIVKKAVELGIKAEVLNKTKIEALKMGGLLAINMGSEVPPTFSILEWKPENHKNSKPIVLVGKGVMFDTGGMNLKPDNYMNDMKCDMSGAAAMVSTLFAIALAKLPIWVITLVPATDNRINSRAHVSGDIITMSDGTTCEIVNTDAEGRVILADALVYAQRYEPELVIDAATLTGAAQRAIGKYGIVAMQNKAENDIEALKKSGFHTYERIAEFPFWEEYGELIKSDVADIKNIGGSEAGMITAGKFLEHFTNYPFIHLDIAGPAFLDSRDSYRGKHATGVCVRLLVHFLKSRYE